MNLKNKTKMTALTIKNTIHIKAKAAEVWDALVNPAKTKVYMFGCETVSSWKVGEELIWRGSYEGKPMDFVKGYIIEIEPNEKLVYSTFDPNSTIEDIQANYLNVTYTLEEANGETQFSVEQGDYSKVAEGEKRYQESYNNGEGWNPILVQIKALIEGK